MKPELVVSQRDLVRLQLSKIPFKAQAALVKYPVQLRFEAKSSAQIKAENR
jgi:hypothetical protein